MEGTDDLNVKGGSLFQKGGYGNAVFSYYIKIVSSGFTGPVLLNIQGAEFSKTIRRKKNLIAAVIGDHDLWPVNHGRHDEMKLMLSKG